MDRMRVTNTVGGSLAGARWVLGLSLVAWGVRVLRARNLLSQPPLPPAKPAADVPIKGFSRISALALRMLVSFDPQPHMLLHLLSKDDQATSGSNLPDELNKAIPIPG